MRNVSRDGISTIKLAIRQFQLQLTKLAEIKLFKYLLTLGEVRIASVAGRWL